MPKDYRTALKDATPASTEGQRTCAREAWCTGYRLVPQGDGTSRREPGLSYQASGRLRSHACEIMNVHSNRPRRVRKHPRGMADYVGVDMSQGICPIEGCTRPIERRDWCKSCYYRLKRQGAITNLPQLPPVRERLLECIQVTEAGCWEWLRTRNNHNYGRLLLANGKTGYAHRVSYETFVAPIPEGLDLDHLCRNPPCINPAHLEPVPHKENLHRSPYYRATECRAGHDLTGANLWVSPTDPTQRDCKICMHLRYLKRIKRLAGG